MDPDAFLRNICAIVLNAVLFGIGATIVLTVPALNDNAKYLLPVVIVASFVIAPFLANFFARRMRIRNWGRANWKKGDILSG